MSTTTISAHRPDPDGVSHTMIGTLVLANLAIAVVMLVAWTDSTVDDMVLAALAVPLLFFALHRRAVRLRDQTPPAPRPQARP